MMEASREKAEKTQGIETVGSLLEKIKYLSGEIIRAEEHATMTRNGIERCGDPVAVEGVEGIISFFCECDGRLALFARLLVNLQQTGIDEKIMSQGKVRP